MMNKLKEKMNKKGFTLAELLIVVAIIAILVAVSIPIFTSKLEKTREETDIANMRAAKSAALTSYMTDEKIGNTQCGGAQTASVNLFYDADEGVLVETADGIIAYGQGTATGGGCKEFMGYTETTVAKDGILTVTIAVDGTVTMTWPTPSTP